MADGLPITINVPRRLWCYLRDLSETGLYGAAPEDAAVRLIERGIQQALTAGSIPRSRRPGDGAT